jgi:hypothetical protein
MQIWEARCEIYVEYVVRLFLEKFGDSVHDIEEYYFLGN